ncbi:MAG: phage terminase large subunit [Acidobacteria bacterium]|nr:phage terminase large subunit [Acidobacteriota bacterium]
MGKEKDATMVEACRVLYMKYGGMQHGRIEAEMHAAGWTAFRSRNLYSTYQEGRLKSRGWIERFGWKAALERRNRRAETQRIRRGNKARLHGTFDNWVKRATPGMKWTARHHLFICGHLQRVTSGDARRLMIFVPPRHGKSELVTVRYAAWRLIREPELRVIVGCYNQKLANRFSRKIKRLVACRTEISKQKHAAEEWETTVGGGVKAVGVGAGITGFGGDLIIIDDPVKGRASADSRTLRDSTWDWYKDDIHTRLEPDGAVIVIQTRWHDDDLAGRLLKDMDDGGEKWESVRLAALAEPEGGDGLDPLGRAEGEALWPERFDAEALLAIKRRLGPRSFAALYQQRPQPLGGTIFRPEWFTRRAAKAPAGLRWARGYDLAVSLKDSADYTASFRCALDTKTGDLYIADGFRKRIEFPEQRRYVLERMAAEPATAHGIELALHGKALVQDLRRDPRAAGRSLRGVKVDGDKLLRAEAWASLAEEGKIVLVNGPWIDNFIDEACRFTGRGDAHDDQIDAVSLAVQMLRKNRGGHSF